MILGYESPQPANDRPISLTSRDAIEASVNTRCHVKIVNAESRKHDDARSKKDVINDANWSENGLVNRR